MKKIIFIIPLFLSLPAFCQIPTNGLIGYWPFNGNSLDESGNNHHAVNGWKYTVNYTTDRFGAASKAYSADSTHLKVPYSSAFDFKTGDKFSISLWAYYPPHDFGFFGEVFTKGSPGIEPNPAIGTYGISFYDTPKYVIQPAGIISDVIFQKNRWYHLAYIYNGDSILTFINGTPDLKVKANITQSPTDMTIGKMGQYFKGGKLDDIAIYNRALSISEINKLYSAAPTAVSETINNLNTISIVLDHSGNYQVRANTPIKNIKVYNVNGSLVKESSNSSVSGLPAGFYIFYISTKEGVVKSKLVVN